jgi:hypothetical protein
MSSSLVALEHVARTMPAPPPCLWRRYCNKFGLDRIAAAIPLDGPQGPELPGQAHLAVAVTLAGLEADGDEIPVAAAAPAPTSAPASAVLFALVAPAEQAAVDAAGDEDIMAERYLDAGAWPPRSATRLSRVSMSPGAPSPRSSVPMPTPSPPDEQEEARLPLRKRALQGGWGKLPHW